MGLLEAPGAMNLESFWRRSWRVGSSGHPGHRKVQFCVNFCGPLDWFGCFWGCFRDVFQWTFVCMRLCGCRVSKVVSDAMSHSIPLDFSTSQYNITSYDVVLHHFGSSYLGLHYIVLLCVVICGFVMKCHGALCFILQWHAGLCYDTSCYCVFKVVWVETRMGGNVFPYSCAISHQLVRQRVTCCHCMLNWTM